MPVGVLRIALCFMHRALFTGWIFKKYSQIGLQYTMPSPSLFTVAAADTPATRSNFCSEQMETYRWLYSSMPSTCCPPQETRGERTSLPLWLSGRLALQPLCVHGSLDSSFLSLRFSINACGYWDHRWHGVRKPSRATTLAGSRRPCGWTGIGFPYEQRSPDVKVCDPLSPQNEAQRGA